VNRMKVLLALALLVSAAMAQVKPGFDPQDVVRRVRHASPRTPIPGPRPLTPEVDDGEFLIDTSVTHAGATGYQFESDIAFDGTNFLVVWTDARGGSDADIFGARVTPSGVVLDSAGIAISTAPSDQQSPALTFDGTSFLVVWMDVRSGSDYEIYGTRVTPSGVVLDPAGFAVSTAGRWEDAPAIAFDGTNFLVVWQDERSGSDCDVYGTRVTPGGVTLDTSGIPVSTAASDQYDPAIAFDGTNFLVVWRDERGGEDIYGARVTQSGVVLDSAGLAITTAAYEQANPTLAFDTANFLVVWADQRNVTGFDIYGTRVTPAGRVLDTSGIAISTAAKGQYTPALAFDGESFLVVWEDRRNNDSPDVYGARVTPAGVVLDSEGIAIDTAKTWQHSPVVAFDGTDFLATWEDHRSVPDYDIYGARLTSAGVVLDSPDIVISTAANWQRDPAVGFDGSNFLAVWEDSRKGSGYTDLRGARVTPTGVVLDSSCVTITTARYDLGLPVLAFDSANFLVVWQDGRSGSYPDVYGARVTPAGVVLDPSGIAVTTATYGQGDPALAFGDTSFLVVWGDWRGGIDEDIYGARVSQSGIVLDSSGIAISTLANSQSYAAVAFDGTDFLVVWEDSRGGSAENIYGARVSQSGIVLDPDGIAISTAASMQESPAVGFDGTNFLVVWDDRRNSGIDIYGARVSQSGIVLDPDGIVISSATGCQWHPTVAFDGTSFLVVWSDFRNGNWDVYGARVSPAGSVSDSGPVVTREGGQRYPALARGPGNLLFLVYQGWAGTVGGETYNSDRVWGKLDPHPGVEEGRQPTAYSSRPAATIVRGVLELPGATSREPQVSSVLLDIGGRKVLKLHPGPNDVSRLAPGVYFVRGPGSGGGGRGETYKVVIQK